MLTDKSQIITDLLNLANALSIAVNQRFMSPEHGAGIWKDYIKKSGLDIPKKITKE